MPRVKAAQFKIHMMAADSVEQSPSCKSTTTTTITKRKRVFLLNKVFNRLSKNSTHNSSPTSRSVDNNVNFMLKNKNTEEMQRSCISTLTTTSLKPLHVQNENISQATSRTTETEIVQEDDNGNDSMNDSIFLLHRSQDDNQQQGSATTATNTSTTTLAVIRVQAIVRGYLQRYEIKFRILQRRLQTIEDRKQKQVKKLQQRVGRAKKMELSEIEFRMEGLSRRLQRTTRVIPYLFRETQAQLLVNGNVLFQLLQLLLLRLETSPSTTSSRWISSSVVYHLKELEASHMALQITAHSYVDSMEDISGIWDALIAQWVNPAPKYRVKRGFDANGKIITLKSTTPTASTTKSGSGRSKHKKTKRLSQEVPPRMAELYLSSQSQRQVDESIEQVHNMMATVMLN